MTRFLSRAIAALSLLGLALAVPALAQQAVPPGQMADQQQNRVLKETHGAWEIHCLQGTETCIMQQFGKTADGRRALVVTLERLAGVTAEGQPVAAAMTVMAPLGVLIPYNVRVKIDQGDVQPIQLVRCLSETCMARAPLREQDIDRFKRGSTARYGFFLNEEVLVDVSLNGFTAAYNALKPMAVPATGQN